MSGVAHAVIPIGRIAVPSDRLRRLRPEIVAEFAESMAARGLIEPIVVRPAPDNGDGFWLVAGQLRLEAAKRLSWPSIGAMTLDGADADAALLVEIDENLIRADLSPAERALHMRERKRLYEALHPETKKGATGRGRQKSRVATSNEPAPAFIDDAERKTGKHRATIAREVARGKITDIADAIGTTLDSGDELDALADLPAAVQHELIERAKAGEKVTAKHVAKKLRRQQREVELAQRICALPDQKCGVILEDFEWDFEVRSRETGLDRHAANHYETAREAHTPQEIIERTKERFTVAADNCILFMWVPIPFLAIGIHVLEGRGFTYKSSFVWAKDKAGTGYWNRERHEYLLIGVKGNIPAPAPGDQFDSLIEAIRHAHSEKPEIFYEIIEKYFPTLPKIELNARSRRAGWFSWGSEAPPVPAHLSIPQFLRRTSEGGSL